MLNLFGEEIEDIELEEESQDVKKARKKAELLRKEIRYHNDLYYNQDNPEISDYEYDMLLKKLKDLEAKYPVIITKDSPTQKVGGVASATFEEVKHDVAMQSLNDVFSFADVEDFVLKIQDEYGKDVEFVVETKIDGLSVSLEYENGILVRGSTRGNGLVGEDVTVNLKQLDSIPEKLNTSDTIEVRGEVYMPHASFEEINQTLEAMGKAPMANPRNAAAGTLRQLDPNLVKARKLSIFVFNVQKSEKKFAKHSESLEYCRKCGINTIEYSKVAIGLEGVLNCIEEIGKMRATLPYDIDGAVVKVNDLNHRLNLGTTTKVPRWAVAYKYPPEEKETVVERITVQVGRTGKITPLAIIKPVRVAGSVISKCTLHNFDYVASLDIREGDTVKIRKAGDVIPEVAEVVMSKRPEKTMPTIAPSVCPVCGELLEKVEGEVDIRCVNSECDAQVYRAITHFVSRQCMAIDQMGEALIEDLIANSLISDVSDIYYLTHEDIKSLEGYQDKSAKNIMNSILKSKDNTLDKLIFGLGIRHVGAKAAKTLAHIVDSIQDLYTMTLEDLTQIEDIGPKIAESIVDFFAREKTKIILQKLEVAGVNLKGIKKELASNKLENKTFCITGSFDEMSRDDIVKLIEDNAGKATNSVSKKTDYLIYGENAGSKLDKAKALNVQLLKLDEFLDMI